MASDPEVGATRAWWGAESAPIAGLTAAAPGATPNPPVNTMAWILHGRLAGDAGADGIL